MKNITITLDLKSLCIGALGVFAIMSLSNFNKSDTHQQDTGEIRRYQVATGEKGTVILDTKTGKYIFEGTTIGRPRWLKGDFEELQSQEKK
ncbi:hypothetical protein ACFSUS_09975 [Spirosoma soli]|uniref:Uncharacterized protein n=1 Tax=Spirosoma soli TaxID=1770529 RepID=A0ABW5M340_9BACT